jgi:hypothetical protein
MGELLYLMMYTHPDIVLTMIHLAQHNVLAGLQYYMAAKHIL